jgi:predicted DNA-binding transcriptional regulator AlpA
MIGAALFRDDPYALRVLRKPEAAAYLGVSKRHFQTLAQRHSDLLPPVALGERAVGWRLCDLARFVQERTNGERSSAVPAAAGVAATDLARRCGRRVGRPPKEPG